MSGIKIEVVDGKVETREGKIKSGARQGEDYRIRTQEAYIHNGHAYPQRFKLQLPDNVTGYMPGFYSLAPESFTVGDYEQLGLSRSLVLVRDEQPAKLAKAS